ncbi:hypothetical protein RirG_091190 [Rhizophagus irregularis DAOM 197198w]|uniref:Uncharacterized protein n=1 Tax=Rhizophagus irregularis (strain DAOM 197198w) TaxID=1432141 RepID=A0A015JKI0_RHIIW|nr:hypothetical protein RirG_091190 [Rhizophagus irregularis DAOM 197198w]
MIQIRLLFIQSPQKNQGTPTTSDDVDVYKGCISCDAGTLFKCHDYLFSVCKNFKRKILIRKLNF